MTRRRLLATLGGALLAYLAACGKVEPGEHAAAARAPKPMAGAPAGEGSVRVSMEPGGLVGVVANDAPRRDVLNALTDAAGFTLMVGPEVELGQPLSLRVASEPLELVLARALVGIPHALFYDEEVASGPRRLVRVTVGITWTKLAESTVSPQPPTVDRAERRAPAAQAAPAPRPRRMPLARVETAEPARPLPIPDEGKRSQIVEGLDVGSPEGFAAATDRLANDESSRVRAAAAEALMSSDRRAMPPLLAALQDPDPLVVVTALDALEFVGDSAVIPALAPLLQHQDIEVRERTQLAIQKLQAASPPSPAPRAPGPVRAVRPRPAPGARAR